MTAGNALLHMVVDDDEVATKIVRLLNQVKGGRVTFLPLSKVRAPDVTYPDRYGDNVVPMIRLLKFDARYTVAMRHVFGKTVVCKNIGEAMFVCVAGSTGGLAADPLLV